MGRHDRYCVYLGASLVTFVLACALGLWLPALVGAVTVGLTARGVLTT